MPQSVTPNSPSIAEAKRRARDAIWTIFGGAGGISPAQADMLENTIASLVLDEHRAARNALLADLRRKLEERKGAAVLLCGVGADAAPKAFDQVLAILAQQQGLAGGRLQVIDGGAGGPDAGARGTEEDGTAC